jgi:hypothetical protein
MAKITVAGFIKTFLSAVDAAAARVAIGLGNVNNTSDANKPVSTAQQAALDLKANLASPALTGTPTAPTPGGADDSTKLATTAFVKAVIAGKLTADPAELALLLEEDPELLREALGVAQDPSDEGAGGLLVGANGVTFAGTDGVGRLSAGDQFFTFWWDSNTQPERPFWALDNSTLNTAFFPSFSFSGTANRIFSFQDKSGTVAHLSDCEITGEVLISAPDTVVIDATHMGQRIRNLSGATRTLVLGSAAGEMVGKSFVLDARTHGFTISGNAPVGPNGTVSSIPAGGIYLIRDVAGVWWISGLTTSQVMLLTGDQTVAGAKTFTSPIVATGTPTLGTHVLNRDQADARYGNQLFAELAADSSAIASTTTYADSGLQLSLDAGVWEVFVLVAIESANSVAGARLRLLADVSVDFHLICLAPQAAPNQVRLTRELSAGTSTAVSGCVLTSGTVTSLSMQGTVRTSATTLLKAQFTQWASDPGNTLAKARSFMVARRIS